MLRKKLLRDLWQNKTQFISIFLMAFLGLFIFAGIDAESNGIGISTKKYYDATNLADAWVLGENFTTENVLTLEQLDSIDSIDRKQVVRAKAIDDNCEYDMELNFVDTLQCSYPYLIEGEPFDLAKDGIWLEEYYAKARGLQVGDYVLLKYEGLEFEEKIKGFIIHPEYISYSLSEESMMPCYGEYGYGYLASKEYPCQDKLAYNRLLIKKNSENILSDNEFKEQIKKALDCEDIIVLERNQNGGIEAIASEKSQHEAMGIMFSSVFLLIAVMGIVTTMTRMTSNQRMQIGTLKALGFSKTQITFHYVSYSIVICGVGSALGAFVGYQTLPPLFLHTMQPIYVLPEWNMNISIQSYIAILLAVLLSALVGFLACKKELKDMPAVTLKPVAPKSVRHFWLEKSKLWLSLSFSTQWNIRDIVRNKTRSLMGIAGVAGCTMLMLCALGCRNSCKNLAKWQYEQLTIGAEKILFEENVSKLKKEEYKEEYKGQLIEEKSCEFRTDQMIKTGTITILDEGNYIHYQNHDGDEIELPKTGVSLTYKMASLLGVKEGDYIEWHIVGEKEWEKTRVSTLYRAPTGQGITMSKRMFEEMDYSFVPTALYTNMTIPQYVRDSDDVSGVFNMNQGKMDLDKNMEAMNTMVIIMIIAAVILGIIVLYNLGVLSFLEKTREIATLKVLGFKTDRIRKILQQQNIWLTVVGIIIGLFLGYQLLDVIMQTVSENQDIQTKVYFLSYVCAILGTWIVSVSVNRILSSKVKTICMVDALKGVE